MKKIFLVLIGIVTIFCFVACDNNINIKDETLNSGNHISDKKETTNKYANVENNPIVTMEMENGNIIKMELYPQIAPTTVENFVSLIESGFYDGLTFHRVIPDFMAQGGDPSGDGTGGPGYTIKGEFTENGFENNLSHEVGVVSMARTNDKNGAGSQFFIATNDISYLDGLYAAFGKVIEGMDYVYDIVNAEVIRTEVDEDVLIAAYDASDAINSGATLTAEQEQAIANYYLQARELNRPINPPKIKSMTIETFGVDYDEPEKIME